MARKRTQDQSNLSALLDQLERDTARTVKKNLGDNWRDNLFEILMTRFELAAKKKKDFSALPKAARKDPLPFAKKFAKTMRNILKLAEAPASPLHLAAFSGIYLSLIDTFMKDDTKDLAKTMAAVDKRLGWFEQLVEMAPCKG